jgi:integrase
VLELGQRWLKEHGQPNLKPGAAVDYRSVFYRPIAPELGPVRVDECRPETIKRLLGRKRESGLSEGTVGKIRRHPHAIFAFAQEERLVAVNPATALRQRSVGQRRKVPGTALTPMQVTRFLEECSPRWRSFFTVALDTGLRRGELIGLRWDDVDLLERVLHVRRSIGTYDDPEDATTKTEAGERVVPILDGAKDALETLYTEAEDKRDEAPVFAARSGPLNPRWVTRVFKTYAERAELPEKLRLHDLRHTAITNAIEQGEDILLISAFAGHAKTSTTLDVYGHRNPKRAFERRGGCAR